MTPDTIGLYISLGILIAVGIGSYFYFNRTKNKQDIQLKSEIKNGHNLWYLK